MATIGEVRTALADTLEDIPDLRVSRYLTEAAPLPGVYLSFAGSSRESMQRGFVTMTWNLMVMVPLSSGRAATEKIDALTDWFGTESVVARIEDNKGLGLDNTNAVVADQVGGDQQVDGWGTDHVARQVTVLVRTRGDQ